jgi:hypothetical protein
MPRSAAELNAELDRLKDEAEKLDDDAHTRLTNAGQTIDTARAKTLEVQTSLSSALAEIAVNNIREAEKHCAQARYRLAVARANVAEAFAGVAGADPRTNGRNAVRRSIGSTNCWSICGRRDLASSRRS